MPRQTLFLPYPEAPRSERIVKASSSEGDWVLDPFCGCATAPVAAEKLGRKWVGIDTPKAVLVQAPVPQPPREPCGMTQVART